MIPVNVLDGLNFTEAAYLVYAMVASIAAGIALLVAIARAEARSRHGERERVAAIRRHLVQSRRQPVQGP